MKRTTQTRYAVIMLILLSMLVVSSISAQDKPVEKIQVSLYERLGGIYSIATVVDEFIERVMVNDVMNANPLVISANQRIPKAGTKFQLTALICQLSGGPEVYNGRNMKDAHAHLNISNAEWDEMVKVFVELLNDFKVPQQEQDELLALLGAAKGDIVTTSN